MKLYSIFGRKRQENVTVKFVFYPLAPLIALFIIFSAMTPKTTTTTVVEENTCDYAFNSVDEFTKKSKIAMRPHHFFSHTDAELRKFMKDEDYLECSGYLSDVAGLMALHLTIVMDSPYAKEEYGSIQGGANLIIRLIDGETVTLSSEKYDPGEADKRKGKTRYSSVFLVGPKDEKVLGKVEVDKVRLVWEAGYEDYEVYELDFFIDQIACISSARNS